MKNTTCPRRAVLYILNRLDQKKRNLDTELEDYLKRNSNFPNRKDLSLFYEILYGTIRWRARLDFIIKRFSKTPIEKIEPEIINILRLGLYQIVFLDRVPNYAAVNICTQITKEKNRRISAFVNGVLRNAARGYKKLSFSTPNTVFNIAIEKSFPVWLIKRWIKNFGIEKTKSLCDALNIAAPITLRTNTLKTSRDILIKKIEANEAKFGFTPESIHIQGPKISIQDMQAFKDGLFQVQDIGAQIVSYILHPMSGDTILEICCGMGGKTGHIAQLMNNSGLIVSVDISLKKLRQFKKNTKRLGVKIAEPVLADFTKPFKTNILFNKILIDAPCSGLGVLRRNPDTKWTDSEEKIKSKTQLQAGILENASQNIAIHGVITYCVCSLEQEEGELIIKNFLQKHPCFVLKRLEYAQKNMTTKEGFIKMFPNIHNTDGFFIAAIQKIKC